MTEQPRTNAPLDLKAWHAVMWAEFARFMTPDRWRALLEQTYALAMGGNTDATALLFHALIPDAPTPAQDTSAR